MAAFRLSAALLLLACAKALAAPADQGALRTFKDWIVGCDNVRSCTATASDSKDDGAGLALALSRTGNADARVSIALTPHFSIDMPERGKVVVSGVPGRVVTLRIGREAVLRAGTLEITSASARAGLLAAMREAPKLRIAFTPPLKDLTRSEFTISLDGVTAALLWMDERQSRVGTTTAIVRKGSAPAATVPSPPPFPSRPVAVLPTGNPAPEKLGPDVLATLDTLRTEGCVDDLREIEPTVAPEIVRLTAEKLLVSLRCWPGASSIGMTYFVVREGDPASIERAIFPRRYTEEPTDPDRATPEFVLFNAASTLKDGTIDHSVGTGGDGHCGEKGAWAWTGEGFEPLEVSTYMPCGGASVPIYLYRTR